MSIYRLYVQNSNCAGFWIQHRNWHNMCAKVMSVAGQRSGGLPPNLDENHEDVILQFYDVRSGRPMPSDVVIDSPENRGYVLIAVPPWSR